MIHVSFDLTWGHLVVAALALASIVGYKYYQYRKSIIKIEPLLGVMKPPKGLR